MIGRWNELQKRWQRRRAVGRHPHIRHSFVERPELVDPTAKVEGAALYGAVHLSEKVQVKQGVKLSGGISIGRYTIVNGPQTDIFSAINSVQVGAFCSIARTVAIQEYNHATDHCSTFFVAKHVFGRSEVPPLDSRGGIVIGNDVWIGTQCVILSGSHIGDGAVIAANSVVTGDVPPYAIVGGTPARVLKMRFEPLLIEALLDLRWWEWPHDRLMRNHALFEGPLTMEKLDALVS